ncbi:helix-turn-helix transcriptional regulator [Levilactobacillus brevis]|uniref:Helix-turn-helix transcriptional regulator n=1 Tax=Levilactobacillus brevis TaxID=1580 RepID=A0AB38X828_LEVBR|nr:helix-turn-helix transcriptional regulator [Levilactobacillus brevis]MCP9613947.1 helix-turn-helix domain-containing protein [Levilactobacillus brevis]WAD02879.1 helix-turn-helix transcriptional regulator [Levilactobacillus brevis]
MLHVTRQSISKWENGRGYPDLDNLVRLSDIYQLSIDELIRENTELASKIQVNNAEIKKKQVQLKKVNTEIHQNTDEGLILILLVLASALIPPIGMVLPLYAIWRNTKYNSLHKTIIVISIVVMIVSLMGTYVIIDDNWITPSKTVVYQVK